MRRVLVKRAIDASARIGVKPNAFGVVMNGIKPGLIPFDEASDARMIVAISKDAEAPIVELTDIELVGALFQVLPQLKEL
jgi:hypothetical protein